MGQATIEAQHIKQVIQEMTIPKLSRHITTSINTDSSAGRAVARHCTEGRDDDHKDPDDSQSSRRLDKASSFCYNQLTS
eukprot:1747021-Amphidinium_carterae.1